MEPATRALDALLRTHDDVSPRPSLTEVLSGAVRHRVPLAGWFIPAHRALVRQCARRGFFESPWSRVLVPARMAPHFATAVDSTYHGAEGMSVIVETVQATPTDLSDGHTVDCAEVKDLHVHRDMWILQTAESGYYPLLNYVLVHGLGRACYVELDADRGVHFDFGSVDVGLENRDLAARAVDLFLAYLYGKGVKAAACSGSCEARVVTEHDGAYTTSHVLIERSDERCRVEFGSPVYKVYLRGE